MENLKIDVTDKKSTRHFEVVDQPHHDADRCKYKVFENGVHVASFTPANHQAVHVCHNPGNLDEKLLDQLADQIDVAVQHPSGKHFD